VSPQFNGLGLQRIARIDEPIFELVIAGWTARDRQSLEGHIAELERLGVARPRQIPMFYRASASLLTTDATIQVLGHDSSGEVEPVILRLGGRTWLGVGSDHTDRRLERQGVSVAKQLCPKPLGSELWLLSDVQDHWDRLTIQSFAVNGSQRELYQQGALSLLRRPDELVTLFTGGRGELEPGTAMFCGTIPVRGELRSAERFEAELTDPVLQRSLKCAYNVRSLPLQD
jgi:hypothetical protein